MSVDHHHLHLLVYGIETYRPLQEREREGGGGENRHTCIPRRRRNLYFLSADSATRSV